MKDKGKKLSKKIIFAIVSAAIIGTIVIACVGLQIAFVVADKIECWRPDYEKIEIRAILDKKTLSDEDYEILYRQTGLTKLGIDRALERGDTGKNRIISIQNDFFAEHKVINDFFAPYICQDKIDGTVHNIFLEDGDILISSSTHISGWRIGHAGLVTDSTSGKILQANAIGDASVLGSIIDFNNRVNFMILSPKADDGIKVQVADFAEENLVGKVYDPTAGVFSNKNKIDKTQCAHIVWYAYNQFGIDIDCNGGLVVTPRNIANSPELEVVQTFGFDIDKLWKY